MSAWKEEKKNHWRLHFYMEKNRYSNLRQIVVPIVILFLTQKSSSRTYFVYNANLARLYVGLGLSTKLYRSLRLL